MEFEKPNISNCSLMADYRTSDGYWLPYHTSNQTTLYPTPEFKDYSDLVLKRMVHDSFQQIHFPNRENTQSEKEKKMTEAKTQSKPSRRIVKIFIVDTDERIPLEKAILYQGDEKLTDSTNDELFFEVPIKELLEKHNELRKTIHDKKVNGQEKEKVFLEPIRIRDLNMSVVELARF